MLRGAILKVKRNFCGREAILVATAIFFVVIQKIRTARDGIILWEQTEAYVGDFGSESDALTPANTIPRRKNVASTET